MRKWRSLTALRACEAVARTGNVSAAAAELNVTRPAISKQISMLEQDLGCALFERTGNRIRLTDAGQKLCQGLKQAFDLISSTTESIARRSGHGQRVRVLVCRDFALGWLAGQVGSFLVESFFKSLKAELVWRRHWQTRREVKIALFGYVNVFYNPRSKHSAPGWKSPVAFEQRAA